MTRKDFQRELGGALDEIAGTPSQALSDRVRWALRDAPERRGPVWIAGLAAGAVAVLLIGVLLVANPLNRQPHPGTAGPGHSPSPIASPSPSLSPSPSAVPSASPSATPDNLPTFVCTGNTTISGQQPPLSAFIDGLRTGTHAGYDRLTIEFKNGQAMSVELRPQAGTTFTRSPSGQPVALAGKSGILVLIHGSDLHTDYSGATDITNAYPVLVEVRQLEDFEGQVQIGLGLSKSACYRAFWLSNPARLVIDIQIS